LAYRYSSKNARGLPSAKLMIGKSNVSATMKWIEKNLEDEVTSIEDLMNEVAEYAKQEAQEMYDEADYAGVHDVVVKHEKNKKIHRHTVTASGEALPYIEFGTSKKVPHHYWFFSAKGRNVTTKSGRLKSGAYVIRHKVDRDNPIPFKEKARNYKIGPDRLTGVTSENIVQKLKEYNAQQAKKGKPLISPRQQKMYVNQVRQNALVAKAVYDDNPKYNTIPFEDTNAVVTKGNKPQKIMSEAYEKAMDRLDQRIGRL